MHKAKKLAKCGHELILEHAFARYQHHVYHDDYDAYHDDDDVYHDDYDVYHDDYDDNYVENKDMSLSSSMHLLGTNLLLSSKLSS